LARKKTGSAPNVEKACEAIGRIVRDGKRAGEVIAQIRALSRKSGIRKQRVDMNEAIEEVLALAQGEVRTRRVALRTDLATPLPPALGDRVQLA
jgi:C4-dicarboxylate-specific signal transduction histidine kinase